MSQTYDPTKPETGVTTFGELYAILRNHSEALRSSFSGTSFPTSPVAGQLCYRTDRGTSGKWYVYTGNPAVGESGWVEIAIEGEGLGQEIINARGSKSTVDQRLDVALNEDGTLKAGTSLNPSQWYLPSLTFTYVSGTSFKVNGDQTDIYVATRRLKVNLSGSTGYTEVVNATYASGPDETTVQVYDSVVDSSLVSVEHSLLSPRKNDGAISAEMVGNRRLVNPTTTYAVTENDSIVACDASGGAFTVTMLSAAAVQAGKVFTLIKTDSSASTVTIDTDGSETINGLAAWILRQQHEFVRLYSDGTNWRVEGRSLPGLRDTARNLVIKNNATNPNYQMDVDADDIILEDENGSYYVAKSVNLTVDITASGANGLDTGSEANSTWYHLWVIYNPDTNTVAGLLSTSATAPTMPSGYKHKAYVGAIYNNASGNFITIYQQGKLVARQEATVLSGGTATTPTSVDISAYVPPTAKVAKGYFSGNYTANVRGATVGYYFNSLWTDHVFAAIYNYTGGNAQHWYWRSICPSQTIHYALNGTGANVDIKVNGWEY